MNDTRNTAELIKAVNRGICGLLRASKAGVKGNVDIKINTPGKYTFKIEKLSEKPSPAYNLSRTSPFQRNPK